MSVGALGLVGNILCIFTFSKIGPAQKNFHRKAALAAWYFYMCEAYFSRLFPSHPSSYTHIYFKCPSVPFMSVRYTSLAWLAFEVVLPYFFHVFSKVIGSLFNLYIYINMHIYIVSSNRLLQLTIMHILIYRELIKYCVFSRIFENIIYTLLGS